ncbi:AraC family transcriptional regulator [Buttiauxella sp. A111]|uniref:AraC family transcriptional regulator n=1 Tax=Buttiauxella sp. A111 TaxID=2563088 RepID=UPI0010DE761A|nr:AraC family transcriptional regulator [Buttiauxella sp. A111]GDX07430.1 AraC family transcriptional regulator [Buttiauxella sp. A111]
MQGVPEQFHDKKDSAQFRHLPQLPGVELYHAHISRYAFEPHTHEAFGIGTVTWGAERFRYRGVQHVAATDSLVLMNPDELHTGEAATEDGWQYRMIYLEPEILEAVTGSRNWSFSEVVNHDPLRAGHISHLINGLWRESDSLAQQGLLLNLIETFQPYARHLPSGSPGSPHRFEQIRDYLHDNYMHPVTLEELAAVVSLSPYHFQRMFKAHFHVTPHQMLMAIRLWRAKQFLTSGMPAAQVAAASGLTDQAHLTRAFSQRYGITPVRYQKQVAR